MSQIREEFASAIITAYISDMTFYGAAAVTISTYQHHVIFAPYDSRRPENGCGIEFAESLFARLQLAVTNLPAGTPNELTELRLRALATERTSFFTHLMKRDIYQVASKSGAAVLRDKCDRRPLDYWIPLVHHLELLRHFPVRLRHMRSLHQGITTYPAINQLLAENPNISRSVVAMLYARGYRRFHWVHHRRWLPMRHIHQSHFNCFMADVRWLAVHRPPIDQVQQIGCRNVPIPPDMPIATVLKLMPAISWQTDSIFDIDYSIADYTHFIRHQASCFTDQSRIARTCHDSLDTLYKVVGANSGLLFNRHLNPHQVMAIFRQRGRLESVIQDLIISRWLPQDHQLPANIVSELCIGRDAADKRELWRYCRAVGGIQTRAEKLANKFHRLVVTETHVADTFALIVMYANEYLTDKTV